MTFPGDSSLRSEWQDFDWDDGTLFSRHFDQTKCVEKSPKAKQYHTLLSTHSHTVIQSVSVESPGKDTDLWWSLRCKWSFPTESEVCLWQVKFHQRWSYGGESIYFFVFHYSYRRLGDLSTTLEMTAFFLIVIQWVETRKSLRTAVYTCKKAGVFRQFVAQN